MKVEFYRHSLTESDIENASKVLRSIFLTTGSITAEFEKKFSRYTGLKTTIAVNSCTAALHLGLLALGIGPGDEVITTPMTFIASVTPIIHVGAKPVFVDVDRSTGLMDVNRIEQAITPKCRAILPVHLYGSMVDMRAIWDIADRHHLKIIEDCAHCVEGEHRGIRPGQLGNAACYSFYATKNLTCGEGGAFVTNSAELAYKVRLLRQHGMSKEAADRYQGNYQHWDMIELGWKYNMDDIHAALLVDQMDSLDKYWQRREEICKQYDAAFGTVPGIKVPEIQGKSARHLYTIWVEPEMRDGFLHKIQDRQIGVAVNYRAVHTLTFFRETFGFKPKDFPIANRIGLSTISLPIYPKLKDSEIEYVIDSIKKIVK